MARHRKKENKGLFNPDNRVFLDVKIHKDHLNNTGRYVGKVEQKYVTIENVVAELSQSYCGLNAETLMFAARLLHDKLIYFLEKGYSVDALGLGKLYLALDGTVKSTFATPSQIPPFHLEFTPSKKAVDSIKNVYANDIHEANRKPIIYSINSLCNNKKIAPCIKSCIVLSGENIKLLGDDSFIKFIPQKDFPNAKEVTFTLEDYFENNPKSIRLYNLKEVLPNVTYNVYIKTRWNKNGIMRKTPVESDLYEVVLKEEFEREVCI